MILNARLTNVTNRLQHFLPSKTFQEICETIPQEQFLALEWLCERIDYYQIPITTEIFDELQSLAQFMNSYLPESDMLQNQIVSTEQWENNLRIPHIWYEIRAILIYRIYWLEYNNMIS